MQVSMTTTQGLERRLEVAVAGEEVATAVDQRLKQLARTVKLKGFRPGKVPFAVVRQQFGGQVHAETISDLMQRSFAEAVTQQKLRPAGDPRIQPITMEPGSELRYAAVFEILPDVVIKPLDTIAIERPAATIGDADVDAMIENMRTQRPVYNAVQRASKDTDRVTMDFEGKIDGAVFDGGKGEGMQIVLGARQILPEIEQALVGMSPDETKSVPTTFPTDYGAPAVAGKQAQFDIKVTLVEERSLPVADDEFAKSFGITEGGIDELRKEVRASMEREVSNAIRGRVREQLFDALYRDNPIDLPQTMVDSQIQETQQQLARRIGAPDPSKLPNREALEPNARRRVALGLLVGEVIRAQNLKVDRAKVEERLENMLATHPNPDEARRQYLGSREAMSQLESAALEDQAIDWALTQVKVVDKPATFSELTGFAQKT